MVTLRRLEDTDSPQLSKLANNINIWNSLRDYMPFPYSEADATAFIHNTK